MLQLQRPSMLTIVQGTMQLEVPLPEGEGKKGEYATAKEDWLRIFVPGECRVRLQHTVIPPKQIS